jgi:hypothetical protein
MAMHTEVRYINAYVSGTAAYQPEKKPQKKQKRFVKQAVFALSVQNATNQDELITSFVVVQVVRVTPVKAVSSFLQRMTF